MKRKTIKLGWAIVMTWVLFFASVPQAQDSLNMRRVGIFDFGLTSVHNVAIKEQYAYVSSIGSLNVLNIENPSLPTLIGTCYISNIGEIAFQDTLAFLCGSDRLVVVNIRQPNNPFMIANLLFQGGSGSIKISGNFVYLIYGPNNFASINISNPYSPQFADTLFVPFYPSDIAIVGNYAFVANLLNGYYAIDISNPYNLTGFQYTFPTHPTASLSSVSSNDSLLFLSLFDAPIRACRVSNPSSPITVGMSNNLWGGGKLICSGNLLFSGSGYYPNRLYILNYSNLPVISEVGYYDTFSACYNMAVYGNYLFYADGDALSVFDFSPVLHSNDGYPKELPTENSLIVQPNPFNSSTMIHYSVHRPEQISLTIYNISGKMVTILSDNYQEVGNYSVQFYPKGLPSGVYFLQMKSNQTHQTRKLLLLC